MRGTRPLFALYAHGYANGRRRYPMRSGRSDESRGARMAEVRPIIPTDVAYTRTAIALHWLTVALIATGFTLGTLDGRLAHCAADAARLRVSQVDRHHRVPRDARAARVAACASRAASRRAAGVAAARRGRVARLALRVDARDSRVGLALQLGSGRAGRLSGRRRASQSRREGRRAGGRAEIGALRVELYAARAGPCPCGRGAPAPFRPAGPRAVAHAAGAVGAETRSPRDEALSIVRAAAGGDAARCLGRHRWRRAF